MLTWSTSELLKTETMSQALASLGSATLEALILLSIWVKYLLKSAISGSYLFRLAQEWNKFCPESAMVGLLPPEPEAFRPSRGHHLT